MNTEKGSCAICQPALLKQLEPFAIMTDETLEKLSKIMKKVSYPKGTHVFLDKEVLENVYFVLSGKFNVYKISDSGERRVIFMLGPGHLLNDNLIVGLPSAVYCESFEGATALVCSKEQLLALMSKDFTLTQAVFHQFSRKLRRTYRQLKNAPTNVAMEKKIAAKLYALSRDYGVETSEGILIDVPLTVTNLSEMLGAQRETISRSLKKLINEELITYENKKVYIHSRENLVQFYKKKKIHKK